jgi:tetratricopeptide (TPR) repeat protein
MRLFICTDHNDEALLETLTDVLDGYRMTIDIDRIIGERDSRPSLQASIQDCEAFVFALTPNTLANRRCHWEFSQAVGNERPIVVVILEEVEPFPKALAGFLTADLTRAPGAEELLDALYVVGATPPSFLQQLFRNRLLLAIVTLVGFIIAYLLAGPYSPYRAGITETISGVIEVANRADSIYNPPFPTADPTLVALQEPLQRQTLSASAEAAFREGQQLARAGNTPAAIAAFNRALELAPGSVGVYIARGGAYLAIDEPDTAWADYTRAIELAPSLALPHLSRAEFYVAINRPESALADVRAALSVEPDNVQALIAQGRAHTLLGDNTAAIAALDRATTLDPQSAAALTYRGMAHAAAGNTKAARGDYDAALALNPVYPLAYAQRGDLRVGLGEPGAVEDYTRAIDLDPNNATARAGRGLLLWAAGDYPVAITDLTRAISVHPKDPALYHARGRAYRCNGEPARAVADYTRAADLDLDATATMLGQTDTYRCAGEPIPEIDPGRLGATDLNLTGAYLYVARALVVRAENRIADGDSAGAISAYTTAIQLNPTYTEAAALYHTRGKLYEEARNTTAARADYTTAADIMPEIAVYHLDAGRMRALNGESDRAIRSFALALNLDPTLYEAHIGRGDVFIAEAALQAALNDYNRAVGLQPESVPALLRRSQTLAALGFCDMAAADLIQATALAPDAPELASTRDTISTTCAISAEELAES